MIASNPRQSLELFAPALMIVRRPKPEKAGLLSANRLYLLATFENPDAFSELADRQAVRNAIYMALLTFRQVYEGDAISVLYSIKLQTEYEALKEGEKADPGLNWMDVTNEWHSLGSAEEDNLAMIVAQGMAQLHELVGAEPMKPTEPDLRPLNERSMKLVLPVDEAFYRSRVHPGALRKGPSIPLTFPTDEDFDGLMKNLHDGLNDAPVEDDAPRTVAIGTLSPGNCFTRHTGSVWTIERFEDGGAMCRCLTTANPLVQVGQRTVFSKTDFVVPTDAKLLGLRN